VLEEVGVRRFAVEVVVDALIVFVVGLLLSLVSIPQPSRQGHRVAHHPVRLPALVGAAGTATPGRAIRRRVGAAGRRDLGTRAGSRRELSRR
jgi:hypothetical protein